MKTTIFGVLLDVTPEQVLALMLIVITSINMPVTAICRVFSVQRGPGNVEESAQWAGVRVWLTAEAHDLRQTRILLG